MARTALTVKQGTLYGGGSVDIAPAAVDQPNGNSFVNDGHTVLFVDNGSGADLDVTFTIPASARTANETATKVRTIAIGDQAIFGPFDPAIYNSSGSVLVDWESGSSVTASPVSLL